MIGFLKEKLERDNDKLMNNNHNLKNKTRKKINEFFQEKVMNNFMMVFIPNYIDLINFKLKLPKMITLGDLKI